MISLGQMPAQTPNGAPPPAAAGEPMRWQIGHATLPDGTTIIMLNVGQGALSVQLRAALSDAEALAASITKTAALARTGLFLPGSGG